MDYFGNIDYLDIYTYIYSKSALRCDFEIVWEKSELTRPQISHEGLPALEKLRRRTIGRVIESACCWHHIKLFYALSDVIENLVACIIHKILI